MINEFSGEGKRKRIYRFFPLKNPIIVLTLTGLERNLDLDLLDHLST